MVVEEECGERCALVLFESRLTLLDEVAVVSNDLALLARRMQQRGVAVEPTPKLLLHGQLLVAHRVCFDDGLINLRALCVADGGAHQLGILLLPATFNLTHQLGADDDGMLLQADRWALCVRDKCRKQVEALGRHRRLQLSLHGSHSFESVVADCARQVWMG